MAKKEGSGYTSHKHADIIETSIFSSLLAQNLLKVEEVDPGPVIIKGDPDHDIPDIEKRKPVEHNFKGGDLIIPNTGFGEAFFFKRGMVLNPNFTYKKANSAESTYFKKSIIDVKNKMKNYAELQNTMYKQFGYE